MTIKNPRAYRTISEVSSDLGIAAHVLRYWEAQFPQLRPRKGPGNRRLYRPEDISVLRQIQQLVHEQGLSLKDARALLREGNLPEISVTAPGSDATEPDDPVGKPGASSEPDLGDAEAEGHGPTALSVGDGVEDVAGPTTNAALPSAEPAPDDAYASDGVQPALDTADTDSEEESTAMVELLQEGPSAQAEAGPPDSPEARPAAPLGLVGLVSGRAELGGASVAALRAIHSSVERVLARDRA